MISHKVIITFAEFCLSFDVAYLRNISLKIFIPVRSILELQKVPDSWESIQGNHNFVQVSVLCIACTKPTTMELMDISGL